MNESAGGPQELKKTISMIRTHGPVNNKIVSPNMGVLDRRILAPLVRTLKDSLLLGGFYWRVDLWTMSIMLSRDLCNKLLPVIRQFPAYYQVSEDLE